VVPFFEAFRYRFTEYRSNFDKQSLKNTTYQFEYDYDSVMHYGKSFFRFVTISLCASAMGRGKWMLGLTFKFETK